MIRHLRSFKDPDGNTSGAANANSDDVDWYGCRLETAYGSSGISNLVMKW